MGPEHAVFAKALNKQGHKEGQNEAQSHQGWTFREELYGKPDINQQRSESTAK